MNRCMITCVVMDLADNLWRMKAFMVGNDFKCWSVGDISRDVNRTFPTHILFKTAGGLGQMMLENILRSLSEYFSNIGYCQVLSMSCCLLNSGNEFCGRCDHHRDRRPEWDWFWRERSERRASASEYGAVGRKIREMMKENPKSPSKSERLRSLWTWFVCCTWRNCGVAGFLDSNVSFSSSKNTWSTFSLCIAYNE